MSVYNLSLRINFFPDLMQIRITIRCANVDEANWIS